MSEQPFSKSEIVEVAKNLQRTDVVLRVAKVLGVTVVTLKFFDFLKNIGEVPSGP